MIKIIFIYYLKYVFVESHMIRHHYKGEDRFRSETFKYVCCVYVLCAQLQIRIV